MAEALDASSSTLGALDMCDSYVWSDRLLHPRASTFPTNDCKRPSRLSVWPSFVSVLQSEVCIALPHVIAVGNRDALRVEIELDNAVAGVYSELVWLNERTFALKLNDLTARTKCTESKHLKLRVLVPDNKIIGRALLLLRSGQDELRRLLQALDKDDINSPEIGFIMQNFVDKLDKPSWQEDLDEDNDPESPAKESYLHMTSSLESKSDSSQSSSQSDLKRATSLTTVATLTPREGGASPPVPRLELLNRVLSEDGASYRSEDQTLLDSFAFMPTLPMENWEHLGLRKSFEEEDVRSHTLPNRKEKSSKAPKGRKKDTHNANKKLSNATGNSGSGIRVWHAVKSLTRRRGYNRDNYGGAQRKRVQKKSDSGDADVTKEPPNGSLSADDLDVNNMISWLHDKTSIEDSKCLEGNGLLDVWPNATNSSVIRGHLEADVSSV